MTAPAVADRRRRFRMQLFLGFLVLLTIAYARQLVSSPTVGQDFRAFYAGATVLRAGENPYDWSVLGAAENALYNAPAHRQPYDPRHYDFQPLPAGPWLYLALEPLTVWPWPAADALWSVLMFALTLACSWLILRQLGWRTDPLRIGLLTVALSPVVFINVFLGQATPLVFCGLAVALGLASRGRPGLAGAVLTVAWIKPNLGLALPVVLALHEPAGARRMLMGFAAGSLAAFAAAYAVLGTGLLEWPRGIIQLWRSVQGTQPDIASLHSFYYPLLSGWAKTVVLVLVVAAIGGYAIWALRRVPTCPLVGMTVLLLWLCAVPYAHSFDTLLLLPVVAILVGPTLRGLQEPLVEATLFAFAVFPLLYFTGLHLGPLNGFGAIPVAICAWAWHRRIVAPATAAVGVAA